jgi:hypothetical protein
MVLVNSLNKEVLSQLALQRVKLLSNQVQLQLVIKRDNRDKATVQLQ